MLAIRGSIESCKYDSGGDWFDSPCVSGNYPEAEPHPTHDRRSETSNASPSPVGPINNYLVLCNCTTLDSTMVLDGLMIVF